MFAQAARSLQRPPRARSLAACFARALFHTTPAELHSAAQKRGVNFGRRLTAPTTKVAFRWGDTAGLGQIQGVSLKRQMNWHFDVSVAARSAPVLHVRIISRLVATEDGRKPFDDPAKMHRLRRSFAKAPPGAIRQREPGDGHGRIRLRCGSTACTAESRCRFVHRPCRRRSEGERNYDASQPSQDS